LKKKGETRVFEDDVDVKAALSLGLRPHKSMLLTHNGQTDRQFDLCAQQSKCHLKKKGDAEVFVQAVMCRCMYLTLREANVCVMNE